MHRDDILTSDFHLSENDSLLKYRFKLLNAMLLTGTSITFTAMLLRFYLGELLTAFVDFSLWLSFLAATLIFRKYKKSFNIISVSQLFVSFVVFTAIVIIMKDDHTKLLWYALLITVAFMLRGERAGFWAYGASIGTLFILYKLPSVDLYINAGELSIAIIFYTAIMIYNALSVRQQQKSMDSLSQANQKVRRQQTVLYDKLHTHSITKLPNTLSLDEKITRSTDNISLVTLKIDDFISLEFTYGQELTEQLIAESAIMLSRFNRPHITLYHIHREQFSFLLEKPKKDEDIHLAESIKSLFENTSISIQKMEISISFSLGIARGKSHKTAIHADTVLQEVMHKGSNHYKLFHYDKQREETQKNNLYWNSKIKQIIHNGHLRVYYQPIVCNKTEKIQKYECLIRAFDRDKIVAPFFFLEAAKSRGMLPLITKTVIESSFKLFSHNNLSLSINITEDDLKSDYLVAFLKDKMTQYNIAPERIYLEILEQITSEESDKSLSQFEALRNMGIKISIDDFGAEASNFSRLLTLNADIIKIDGQFIKNLDTDPNSIKIVETIVSLARKMGSKTVAEFVHNEEIYHIVKRLGVDYSQGYYFGAPHPQLQEETQELVSA